MLARLTVYLKNTGKTAEEKKDFKTVYAFHNVEKKHVSDFLEVHFKLKEIAKIQHGSEYLPIPKEYTAEHISNVLASYNVVEQEQ